MRLLCTQRCELDDPCKNHHRRRRRRRHRGLPPIVVVGEDVLALTRRTRNGYADPCHTFAIRFMYIDFQIHALLRDPRRACEGRGDAPRPSGPIHNVKYG